jgi:5'-nucleotidase
MDDVTAELLKYCCAEHNATFGTTYVHTKLEEWGLNLERFGYLFDKPGTFANLEVVPHAKECLRFLHDLGHEIWFVTNPWTKQSVIEKMDWVDIHFPFLGWQRVIATKDKGMIKGDLLLDDSPNTLVQFEHGMQVCFHKLYNCHVSSDHRVHDWLEFTQLVLQMTY